MLNKLQISGPLTAVKQGMFLVTAIIVLYISLVRIPVAIAGSELEGLAVSAIIWTMYGIGMFIYTFRMEDQSFMTPAFRFGTAVVAPISVALWIGIRTTNFVFHE
jgi:hypothetical protein